jgi:hypothetical protein
LQYNFNQITTQNLTSATAAPSLVQSMENDHHRRHLGEYEATLIAEHRREVAVLSELSAYRRNIFPKATDSTKVCDKYSSDTATHNHENLNPSSSNTCDNDDDGCEMERLIRLKRFQNKHIPQLSQNSDLAQPVVTNSTTTTSIASISMEYSALPQIPMKE